MILRSHSRGAAPSKKGGNKQPLLSYKHNTASNDKGHRLLGERTRNERLLANRNYFLYLSSLLRRTQLYHLWHQYLSIFRKFKLISFLFRLYSYVLVLLQLGTAFFVIITGLLILLPILLLGALSVIFSALVLYRKQNKAMARRLFGKRILVFFPERDGEFEVGNLWRSHIRELAAEQNTAVVLVSPFFWSGKGLDKHKFYLLTREENENVFLIRKHYFFSFKRSILEKNRDLVAMIY